MEKSTKTKEQILRDGFACFAGEVIPEELFQGYINDVTGEGTLRLQEWFTNNMKGWILDWCAGIAIIEAVEHLYKVSLENGNISGQEK